MLKVFSINGAPIPTFMTPGSACFDLGIWIPKGTVVKGYDGGNNAITKISNGGIIIDPTDRLMLPTGLKMSIPAGYYVQISARSSVGLKKGLWLTNGIGVVDSDFVDEVMLVFGNLSDVSYVLTHGDRLAQGRLVCNACYEIGEGPEPVRSCRTGGFGSTGD